MADGDGFGHTTRAGQLCLQTRTCTSMASDAGDTHVAVDCRLKLCDEVCFCQIEREAGWLIRLDLFGIGARC